MWKSHRKCAVLYNCTLKSITQSRQDKKKKKKKEKDLLKNILKAFSIPNTM